jgi:lauroyl/myristoyl acyltransferase
VKLAMASGAPLVPVFVPRAGSGFEVHMYEAMFPDDPGVTEKTLMRYMVESIEKCVTTYPEQWLMPKRFWVD